MFKNIPEENSHKNKLPSKKRNKRKKKGNQNKQVGARRDRKKTTKLTFAMSDWAENFASAATWQLKHQLAYWKARAKSLEYENKVLHDIIRKKHYNPRGSECSTREQSESEEENVTDEDGVGEEDEDFEVSEEFIQFLTTNARYKEEARLEKERLKTASQAKAKNLDTEMEESVEETSEQRQARLMDLYGKDWQRISALEMALQSKYIDDSDNNKPVYWPHLPFNLNYN